MAKIAVLIPYDEKHRDCFMEAVGSIEDQTYKDVESYPIRDFPALGKGFRMNKVIPDVTEKFINVHDADDLSVKDRFEICSQYFDDYDVIYHDVFVREGLWGHRFWDKRRFLKCTPESLEENYIISKSRKWDRELYKKVSYIAASTIIVRTKIAKKVKWVSNTYGQDWIWLNLIAEHTNRFKYIPEPLLYYRGEMGFTKSLKFKRIRRAFIRMRIAKELRERDKRLRYYSHLPRGAFL